MTTKSITSKAVSKLKQKAKELKRSSDLTHQQALEQIAIEYGFDNWHQVTLANQPFKAAEETFKNGIYVLYDVSEADGMRDIREFTFEQDDLAPYVCKSAMKKALSETIDEETDLPLGEVLSQDEFNQDLEDFIDSFVFFKLKLGLMRTEDLSQTINVINALASDWNFWLPRAYIIDGKFIYGDGEPTFDEEAEEDEHYKEAHWPENQINSIDGIYIDPLLPDNFDSIAHQQRPILEIEHWWGIPFIRSYSNEGRTIYHVRMLDGGAWDRTTGHGAFETLEEALSLAKTLRE